MPWYNTPKNHKTQLVLLRGATANRPSAASVSNQPIVWLDTATGELSVPHNGVWTSASRRGQNDLTAGDSTMDREDVIANVTGPASGVIGLTFFTASATGTYTKLRTLTGTTAAGATPTTAKLGLYSVASNGDLTRIAITANDTALFNAANTKFEKATTASFSVSAGDRLAFATLVVSGAAVPSFAGRALFSAAVGTEAAEAPRMSAVSAGGQTDIAATLAAGTLVASAGLVYGVLVP